MGFALDYPNPDYAYLGAGKGLATEGDYDFRPGFPGRISSLDGAFALEAFYAVLSDFLFRRGLYPTSHRKSNTADSSAF